VLFLLKTGQMKKHTIFPNKFRYEKEQHIPNPRTGSNQLYRPCADKKGLHCEGDQFGYVVDWEITENEEEAILVR
jgi:hypothetical protein